MPSFKDNLESFPTAEGIARVELLDAAGRVTGTVENRPGSQGSVRLYLELQRRFGTLTAEAAREGCALYAEHHADARLNPGKHPNVDRLLAVADGGVALSMRVVRA
ncbi:MAG: DUF2322 family protein [bacterium]